MGGQVSCIGDRDQANEFEQDNMKKAKIPVDGQGQLSKRKKNKKNKKSKRGILDPNKTVGDLLTFGDIVRIQESLLDIKEDSFDSNQEEGQDDLLDNMLQDIKEDNSSSGSADMIFGSQQDQDKSVDNDIVKGMLKAIRQNQSIISSYQSRQGDDDIQEEKDFKDKSFNASSNFIQSSQYMSTESDDDDFTTPQFNIIMHEIAPEVLKCLCTKEMTIRLADKNDYKMGYRKLRLIQPKILSWKFLSERRTKGIMFNPTRKKGFKRDYKYLFPKYKDEIMVIVVEIEGKVEGALTMWLEYRTDGSLEGHLDEIMIDPNQKKHRNKIQCGLLLAFDTIGLAQQCEYMNIPEDTADEHILIKLNYKQY